MKIDLKINPPSWMRDPDLILLLDTLNKDDINARMVGGCIRNHLFNKSVNDIDIACKFTPDKTVEILKNAKIKTIPTGLKHGTITAHINGKNFEITTLRSDVKTDGRHATVKYSTDWVEDAKRRDFTINALYADRDGSIYDPLGNGLNDIQNNIVRFIGDPNTRITEDYLRILRFFRFSAAYNKHEFHEKSMTACKDLKDGIDELSDERIFDEVFKILKNDNADKAIKHMNECGILNIDSKSSTQLKTLIQSQNQLSVPDITARYSITNIDIKYIKNNKLKLFIKLIDSFKKSYIGDIKHSLYFFDRDIVIQGLLILKSIGNDINDLQISDAMSLKKPEFPIVANDVIHQFDLKEGPEIGIKLRQAETVWVESNFTLNHQQILDKIS